MVGMDVLLEVVVDMELKEVDIVLDCSDIELGREKLGVGGNMEGREYRDPPG